MPPADLNEALLVAHGAPADPAPQEAVMMALAVRVAMWCPGWRIRGATLAMPGALEAALGRMAAPLIYPFFMAEGWFTKVNLPRRLAAAGRGSLRQLPPFGTDPALPDLMQATALRGVQDAGMDPAEVGLLIAGHGSKVSTTSTITTYAMIDRLRSGAGFGRVEAGFVEEAPFLEGAARDMGRGVCLPFFALRAGHVTGDLPEALAEAGFDGPLLAPIGEDEGVARLIAAALERESARADL